MEEQLNRKRPNREWVVRSGGSSGGKRWTDTLKPDRRGGHDDTRTNLGGALIGNGNQLFAKEKRNRELLIWGRLSLLLQGRRYYEDDGAACYCKDDTACCYEDGVLACDRNDRQTHARTTPLANERQHGVFQKCSQVHLTTTSTKVENLAERQLG